MLKAQNIMSKQIYICHDFTRKPKMFNLSKNFKSIIKKKFRNINFVEYKKKSKKIKMCQIYWGDLISENRISNLKKLQWIHLASSGVDKLNNIIIKSIKVSNSKGIMTEAVSNTVISYIFYFTRGIGHLINLRNKKKLNRINFNKNFDELKILSDCSFLIFGNGSISKEMVKFLKKFSKNVSVVSKRESLKIKTKSKLKLDNFDFIINLLPKNNFLVNYFDYNFFKLMNKKSYFINVGRGDTVNEEKLYVALKQKIIKGAAIDVFKEEPLKKTNKLLKLENCFISPHTAGWYNNYWSHQTNLFMYNLNCFIKKKKFKNQIYNVK